MTFEKEYIKSNGFTITVTTAVVILVLVTALQVAAMQGSDLVHIQLLDHDYEIRTILMVF